VPFVPFVIDANLDCESRWSGLAPSRAVQGRISLYGALVSALAPDGDVELWTPAAIDPARWRGRPITFRTGSPARADLRWAAPAARAANDRRLAQAVARTVGAGLPGARSIDHAEHAGELDARLAGAPFDGAWVAKAVWSAAGRDRCRGHGPPTAEQRTRLGRLLATCGALIVEPWCDRIVDVGVCATVGSDGRVVDRPPHKLIVDARGGFAGIDRSAPALEPGERALLGRAVGDAATALAAVGYAGPFAVDAFVYRDGAHRRLCVCEINARHSFGWIAHAVPGCTRLGLAGPVPDGADTLIAPAADGVTAWIA